MPYNDMGIDCSPTRALLVLPLVPPALKSLCYHHIGLDIFLPHIGPDTFSSFYWSWYFSFSYWSIYYFCHYPILTMVIILIKILCAYREEILLYSLYCYKSGRAILHYYGLCTDGGDCMEMNRGKIPPPPYCESRWWWWKIFIQFHTLPITSFIQSLGLPKTQIISINLNHPAMKE